MPHKSKVLMEHPGQECTISNYANVLIVFMGTLVG